MRTLHVTRPWMIAVVFGAVLTSVGLASDAFAQGPTSRADFNADGFDDLAVGAPGHGSGAGGVSILFGAAAGLTTVGRQFFSQDSSGIAGGEEGSDNCGASLATGDFDGDGFTDLAFGCPGETLDGVPRVGVVIVLFGSPTGLSGTGSRFFHQNSSGVNGTNEADDRCGTALAAGDFNKDGRADLAWGCPGEAVGSKSGAGAVNVIYGSPTGPSGATTRFFSQDTGSLPDSAETDDHCGQALTAADFNGDGRDDLAIGCPGEDLGPLGAIFDAGAVSVLFGSTTGLRDTGGAFLTQDSVGSISNGVEAFDQCGSALGAGDADGDGFADLVMGCPNEDFVSGPFAIFLDAGSVHLFFGNSGGFTQGGLLPPVVASFLSGGRCGAAVAAGDFDGDGFADVAWGCPTEDSAGGRVRVSRGAAAFGGMSIGETWTQNSSGILDQQEANDAFGTAVATGDFNGDRFADLAIGVPGEGNSNSGAVNVLYGSATGLSAAGDQVFNGLVLERFGFALAGSGGTAGPGLTGTWEDVTLTCRGHDDDRCSLRGTFIASNPSTQSTPKVMLRFFLSADQTLDDDDVLLDEMRVTALRVGQSQQRRLHVRLPHDIDATGQFVIAFIDADNVVIETNEQNNVVPSGPIH